MSELSYLAAEQVERALGEVEWIPTARVLSRDQHRVVQVADLLDEAEAGAQALRLPLVIPERFGAEYLSAWRAAAFASERGAGARFALAASRLAFCGGFDLDAPSVLAEAAAAAGIAPNECLAAAQDPRRDMQLRATAGGLLERVGIAPAIRVDGRWFGGTTAVAQAASFAYARATYGGSA